MSFNSLLSAIIITQTALHVTALTAPHPDFYVRESQIILQQHNLYRMCHNAPALELDLTLSTKAQQCAADFAANKSQPADRNGTNLFSDHSLIKIDSASPFRDEAQVTESLGVKAVDQWYHEQLMYPKLTATNFSQLAWKSTKKLGVGIVQENNGEVFICCKYDPAGNIPGFYEDNVSYLTKSDSCLRSISNKEALNAALWKNSNPLPPVYLLLQLENETASSTGDDAETSEADTSSSEEESSSTESTTTTSTASTATMILNMGRNCTGPNCSRSNDTRPLMTALKRELQMAVLESSKTTNDLVKIAIIVLALAILLLIVILAVTCTALVKIMKMDDDDLSCCETGNDTPADDQRFAKSVAGSASAQQSSLSYM